MNRYSLYYVAVEPNKQQNSVEEALMVRVRIDYWHNKCPYMGSRKITVMLLEEGYQVSRKVIRRLMQHMGIYAIYPKINLS